MHKDRILSDGTVVKAEVQDVFLSLAALAQAVGEAEAHGEDATKLRTSLQRVIVLTEELPFPLGMAAASRVLGYIDVASDHSGVPACGRCNGEGMSSSPKFWDSGIAADLLEVLEEHLLSM